MTRSSADVRCPEFHWLIEHAGWRVLPAAPGDDRQGPDVRERIGKNGVVFSAYPIPRGGSRMGRVDLDVRPRWTESSGLACETSVEEVCSRFGFAGDPERAFQFLDTRLEEVKSWLGSDELARTKLNRAIALLGWTPVGIKNVWKVMRPQIGTLATMKVYLRGFVSDRRDRARYRRVLSSLGPPHSGE
jgi:hypothetical protein